MVSNLLMGVGPDEFDRPELRGGGVGGVVHNGEDLTLEKPDE